MLIVPTGVNVYLACGATDLRKSIDGLAAIVTYSFKLDLFTSSVFVFCNGQHNKIKILLWDNNGFWLYYRRLDKGTFRWPKAGADSKTLTVSQRQLRWLLDGLALEQRKAHAEVHTSIAA
jgi:transposase